MKDTRLVERQKFLLEQAKKMIKMLQIDTDEIDWEQIAQIGKTITTTSLTAEMLTTTHQYIHKKNG